MFVCFAVVAGVLAHPVQTDEKIEGLACFEDGMKMLEVMQAPAESRKAFNAQGQEVDDPAAAEFLEARKAEQKRNEALDKLIGDN